MKQPEFLPTTRDEMTALGWDELDVLLVSGDAYVDSHAFGASLLGRWLVEHGYRTGIVAQPPWENTEAVTRMGRPRLFAGVTAGSLDSLLAHYTAFRKKRGEDAYSPGGRTGLRPNRAATVYTGLIRQAFPGLPVAAGGIEASLRRAAHYDFWSDSLRRSLLLDSKADVILYGMAEKSILAFAELFAAGAARQRPGEAIMRARLPGTVYAVPSDAIPDDAEELPSHEAILAEPALLIKATLAFERQMPTGTPCLIQRFGGRAVVFEPPAAPLTTKEMDRVYGMPFARRAHPGYREPIPAAAMLAGSIVSHRGCAGGCSFCSLAIHQGRTVQSRGEPSIMREIDRIAADPEWKGSVTDIGGPSSNMWGAECRGDRENCARSSCLFPKRCRHFAANQEEQIDMLRRVAARPDVRHVRVASGVRHDLAVESENYMRALVGEFTGGQLKIAPEHITEKVLRLMRKPPIRVWEKFIKAFGAFSREADKEQYIVPYLMSAFPGCTDADMEELAAWLRKRGWRPQQVQCFVPTPGTVATAMFFSGQDTEGRAIPVARTDADRLRQHRILMPDAEPPPRDATPKKRPERPFKSGRPLRPRRPAGGPAYRSEGSRRAAVSGRPERPFRTDGSSRPAPSGSSSRPSSSNRPSGGRGPGREQSAPPPRSGRQKPGGDFRGRDSRDGKRDQSGGSKPRGRKFGDRK